MAALFADALDYEDLMGRWSVRLAPLFAEFARVADGARVLDVGCGTGSLVRTLVSMTRRSEIVGLDPVAPFVEYARRQVKDPRVSFEVGDAQALPYPPASFDCALSLLVFHFIPDADQAAREMRRVTRQGGTVAACTWDRSMELSGLFWNVASELDPSVEAKRPQRLNQAGQLGDLWRAAGLREVEERALEISMDFGSFNDYWRPLEKGVGPQGVYLVELAPERRKALRHALEDHLRARGAPGAFSLGAKALAIGRAHV